jgi:ribosomal protein S18 acetylase RimI-like enzyme
MNLKDLKTTNDYKEFRNIHRVIFPSTKLSSLDIKKSHLNKIVTFKEKPVGIIYCKLESIDCVYIASLGILAPYRNMGIGSHLLRSVLEEIKQNNKDIKYIRLHMLENDLKTKKFYESLGFKQIEIIKNFYKKQKLNAWKYQLTIK